MSELFGLILAKLKTLRTQQKIAQYITNINRNKFPNQDVNAAIASIKANRAVQFVDWCPTGFKVKTF